MATRYRGFSTVGRYKKFRTTDYELVKQNLLNHFNIRKGEKLMNPEFGTIIWNCLFEPFTDEMRTLIVQDVARIVNYDPRVTPVDITVDEYENGIQIEIDMIYVMTNQQDTLELLFNRESNLAVES
jgi:phage baseplate assembly protein W